MNHLENAAFLTDLMDRQFSFFGINFGLDALLGLIPGGGDLASALLSFYLVWIGYQMHLPKKEINKMIANIAVDFVLGAVPLVGDVSDIFFKANVKNLEILRRAQTFQELNSN